MKNIKIAVSTVLKNDVFHCFFFLLYSSPCHICHLFSLYIFLLLNKICFFRVWWLLVVTAALADASVNYVELQVKGINSAYILIVVLFVLPYISFAQSFVLNNCIKVCGLVKSFRVWQLIVGLHFLIRVQKCGINKFDVDGTKCAG